MEFLIIVGLFGVVVAIILHSAHNKIIDKQQTTKIEEKSELYDVALYLDNGELFKQYHNVAVIHWDNNIYFFKNETINDRVHKSDNVTMIRTQVTEMTLI